MIKKIKTIILAISLLALASCSSWLNMEKKNFDIINGQKMMAFKLKINYNGKYINNNYLSQIFHTNCRSFFSENNKVKSDDVFIKTNNLESYKVKGDYVFIKTNNLESYLNAIECSSYRVFYVKSRFKRIKNKIASLSKESDNAINYVGDIEVEWNSQIFKITDLFTLGHLFINDKGTLSIRKKENYSAFVEFMKNEYDIEETKLNNAFNIDISKNIVLEN